MQFRYKLAKETFKNKKVPPKKAPGEDNISPDQRGNDTSWTDSQLLSLDKETKRVEPKAREEKPREVSRRDLFSFARLTDFAEAVEAGEKNLARKKKTGREEPDPDSQDSSEASGETSAAESQVSTASGEANTEPDAPARRKGFFKRIFHRLRPGSTKEEPQPPPPKPSKTTEINAEDEASRPSQDSATAAPSSTDPTPTRVEAARSSREPQAAEEPPAVEPAEDEEVDPATNRRNLLRQGVHFFAKPAVEKVQNKINRVNETLDKITKRVPLIRPPGAISEQQFLQACTRCDKCIHACPKDAIQRVPKKMGFLIMGTPYIDPKKIPCVMCDDLPCIPACPDGALVPPESGSRFDVKMGYAILDKSKCQAYGDTFCQQCVIDCPIPGAITQTGQKPIFHKNVCTGCGVCVLSCSTVNIPLAIKIKPQMVIESQLRKKRLEQERERIQAERQAAEKKAREEEALEQESPAEDLQE
ncbi:MAG: 4Fe-4S dicluster domain-containing protein [Nitrospinaceae bacterium]